MKIFISWSGPHAREIATALREWLEDVFENGIPFMSSIDIPGGTRGLNRIEEELAGARFGIIITTLANQNAPWLNYEAGALSKVVDDAGQRVMPILVDLTDAELTSPLNQFQAAPLSADGIRELVRSIGEQLFDFGEGKADKKFDTYWPQLEERLSQITPPEVDAASPPARDLPEVVDEILTIVRSISRAVDEELTAGTALRTLPQSFRHNPAAAALWLRDNSGTAIWEPKQQGLDGGQLNAIRKIASKRGLEVDHFGTNGAGTRIVALAPGTSKHQARRLQEALDAIMETDVRVIVARNMSVAEED
ncbi:MAG TPA: toll/interleukin-1 receptor domain-containing protein [Nocardioides sp.]|nr:toll/interleukin-1 receptor domain-containing protein [Nocardioides sp.]